MIRRYSIRGLGRDQPGLSAQRLDVHRELHGLAMVAGFFFARSAGSSWPVWRWI